LALKLVGFIGDLPCF